MPGKRNCSYRDHLGALASHHKNRLHVYIKLIQKLRNPPSATCDEDATWITSNCGEWEVIIFNFRNVFRENLKAHNHEWNLSSSAKESSKGNFFDMMRIRLRDTMVSKLESCVHLTNYSGHHYVASLIYSIQNLSTVNSYLLSSKIVLIIKKDCVSECFSSDKFLKRYILRARIRAHRHRSIGLALDDPVSQVSSTKTVGDSTNGWQERCWYDPPHFFRGGWLLESPSSESQTVEPRWSSSKITLVKRQIRVKSVHVCHLPLSNPPDRFEFGQFVFKCQFIFHCVLNTPSMLFSDAFKFITSRN